MAWSSPVLLFCANNISLSRGVGPLAHKTRDISVLNPCARMEVRLRGTQIADHFQISMIGMTASLTDTYQKQFSTNLLK